MKKTIIPWLAPFLVFISVFLSSRLHPPFRSSPQAALQHLVVSMKQKYVAGMDEVCTRRGKAGLVAIEKNAELKNLGLYNYLKSKDFRFNPSTQDSLDIWHAWSNGVDLDKVRIMQSSTGPGAVDCDFKNDTMIFIFTKTTWGDWRLDGVTYPVVR